VTWDLVEVRRILELGVQGVLRVGGMCLVHVWPNIPSLASFSLVFGSESGSCSFDVGVARMFHQRLMRPLPPRVWSGANAALQLMTSLIVSCAGRPMVSTHIRPLDW